MEAKEFEFLFRHRGRKFTGTLQIMRPFKTRMYRVYVERAEGRDDAVFIFYEVNEPGQRFFYYLQDSFKDEMAASIWKQLINY